MLLGIIWGNCGMVFLKNPWIYPAIGLAVLCELSADNCSLDLREAVNTIFFPSANKANRVLSWFFLKENVSRITIADIGFGDRLHNARPSTLSNRSYSCHNCVKVCEMCVSMVGYIWYTLSQIHIDKPHCTKIEMESGQCCRPIVADYDISERMSSFCKNTRLLCNRI